MSNVATKELPVKLTDTELLQRGLELAKLDDQLEVLETRRKALMDEIKSEKTDLLRHRHRLQRQLSSQMEMRPVAYHEERDYYAKVVRYIREDTYECFHTRGMEPQEYNQPNLPMVIQIAATRPSRDAEVSSAEGLDGDAAGDNVIPTEFGGEMPAEAFGESGPDGEAV